MCKAEKSTFWYSAVSEPTTQPLITIHQMLDILSTNDTFFPNSTNISQHCKQLHSVSLKRPGQTFKSVPVTERSRVTDDRINTSYKK